MQLNRLLSLSRNLPNFISSLVISDDRPKKPDVEASSDILDRGTFRSFVKFLLKEKYVFDVGKILSSEVWKSQYLDHLLYVGFPEVFKNTF